LLLLLLLLLSFSSSSSREETRRPFERERNEEKSAKTTTRRRTLDVDVGARRIMVLFLLFTSICISGLWCTYWGKCDKNTVAFLPEDEDKQKSGLANATKTARKNRLRKKSLLLLRQNARWLSLHLLLLLLLPLLYILSICANFVSPTYL